MARIAALSPRFSSCLISPSGYLKSSVAGQGFQSRGDPDRGVSPVFPLRKARVDCSKAKRLFPALGSAFGESGRRELPCIDQKETANKQVVGLHPGGSGSGRGRAAGRHRCPNALLPLWGIRRALSPLAAGWESCSRSPNQVPPTSNRKER